jgi:hypothetical protein
VGGSSSKKILSFLKFQPQRHTAKWEKAQLLSFSQVQGIMDLPSRIRDNVTD